MAPKTGVKECLNCPVPGPGLKKALKHIGIVTEAGYGKIEITIKDGQIVYIEYRIGEQVKMDLT